MILNCTLVKKMEMHVIVSFIEIQAFPLLATLIWIFSAYVINSFFSFFYSSFSLLLGGWFRCISDNFMNEFFLERHAANETDGAGGKIVQND